MKLKDTDYVVIRGKFYRVGQDDHGEDPHLVEVDEIPQEYWDRWPEADNGEETDT